MEIILIVLIFMASNGSVADLTCGLSAHTSAPLCVEAGQPGSPWDNTAYDMVKREIKPTQRVAQNGDVFVIEERNGIAQFYTDSTSTVAISPSTWSDDIRIYCHDDADYSTTLNISCEKITVVPIDDNIAESDEDFTLTRAGKSYTIRLQDDDISWVYFLDRWTHNVSVSGDQPFSIRVTMSKPSNETVCIGIASKTTLDPTGYAIPQWRDRCIPVGSEEALITLPTRPAGVSGQIETITLVNLGDGNQNALNADVRIDTDSDFATMRIKWVD